MKDQSPQNVEHFLHRTNVSLRNIFAKVTELEKLQKQIDSYLSENIRPFCLVANQIEHKLVLLATSGAVATALRFQQNHLLAQCHQHPALRKINTIEIKVRPFSKLSPFLIENEGKKQKPMPPLSPQSSDAIKAMAATIKDDKLKATMLRIAEHHKKGNIED